MKVTIATGATDSRQGKANSTPTDWLITNTKWTGMFVCESIMWCGFLSSECIIRFVNKAINLW